LLRSKAAAARRSTRRAEFDDDSDGIDRESEEDHGEYAKGGPTTRDADAPRKTLKRRRRQKSPVELDDEEKDRRAEARRKKEIEKQAKALSTMYVHDSDDEDWDAEKDAAFFAREQAIREENLKVFKRSLVLGTVEPVVSKKRKADAPAKKSKRRKSPPKRKAPFGDSEDDMDDAESSRAPSVIDDNEDQDEDDETTDTPLSSQNAGATIAVSDDADTPRKPLTSNATKDTDAAMPDANSDDDDEDDAPVARRPAAARNMRAGFVIDSDSE
jgi:replication fork protection complex subunit Tof1/Swi1